MIHEQRLPTVAATFGAIARERTDAKAIIDERNAVSYAELAVGSDDVARSLLAVGVHRGDRVACLMRNRIEWIICCLAAAKIGATFVPLNTWYRRSELAWTLRHTGAVFLMAEPDFLGHDYAADIEAIEPQLRATEPGELDGDELPDLRGVAYLEARRPGGFAWEEFLRLGTSVKREELEQRVLSVQATDPWFILYTSGSTADPKGVVLPQGASIVNGIGIGDRRRIEAEDRIWLGSPLFYGLGSVNALPVALTHGSTLVLQDRFDPDLAIQRIEGHHCTVFYGMSNMIRQIRDCSGYDKNRLRSLTKGTAGIERPERMVLLQEIGVSGATQSYGATEVCGNCFGGHPSDSLELKLETCGQLLPGFEALVVDPQTGSPLPAGEIGMLKIRGYTALGYLHNPDETAAAFDSDGYYVTGDLGSIGPDGYFRYHGRVKEMLKTGGINVSPAEIEHLVQSHPAVKEAYVVGLPDAGRGEIAVAIVVASDDVTESDVQSHVKSIAASFKVPRRVIFVDPDTIPRTASGKVAKTELRSMLATQELG